MACPHVTAAAAYIKSFHPDWSPATIKSALMTTATPMSSALNPEAEFAYGAGQIDPIKAVSPGLVYDANEIDYVKFLCGQGYDTKKIRTITADNSSCTQDNIGTVWDLNLPSFALYMNTSTSFTRVFHRTVTNVGSATSKYRARVTIPPSLLNFKVEPDVLSFSSVGQKKSFTLTIEGRINVGIVSSSLIWDDGTFQVRSPIVVYFE
ncbi:cucumisin [Cajanus cajan]|nr:cucumisin [Cajanus cajan]